MLEASFVSSPTAQGYEAAPFLCTLAPGGGRVAWVSVAGELDLLTSPVLVRTLVEARACAGLVVVDAREVTFIDCSGIHAILDAGNTREHDEHRLMLIPSGCVERTLDLAGLRDAILICSLSPQPRPTLRLVSD